MENYFYILTSLLLFIGLIVLLVNNNKIKNELIDIKNSDSSDLRSKEIEYLTLEKNKDINNNELITKLKIKQKDEMPCSS